MRITLKEAIVAKPISEVDVQNIAINISEGSNGMMLVRANALIDIGAGPHVINIDPFEVETISWAAINTLFEAKTNEKCDEIRASLEVTP